MRNITKFIIGEFPTKHGTNHHSSCYSFYLKTIFGLGNGPAGKDLVPKHEDQSLVSMLKTAVGCGLYDPAVGGALDLLASLAKRRPVFSERPCLKE